MHHVRIRRILERLRPHYFSGIPDGAGYIEHHTDLIRSRLSVFIRVLYSYLCGGCEVCTKIFRVASGLDKLHTMCQDAGNPFAT